MDRRLCTWLVLLNILTALSTTSHAQSVRRWTLSGQGQGTTWSVIYFSDSLKINQFSIDSLLRSLDSSLSIYQPNSVINRFNESPNGFAIDQHLKKVVVKSLQIFRKTKGRFDITVKPLVEAWGFAAKHPANLPDSQRIRDLLPCIGSEKLSVSGCHLHKALPCTEIDVNGIAQGYTVDCMASLLLQHGITNYVAEIGGEVRAQGTRADGTPMRIGIETPVENVAEPSLMQRVVELKYGAITTSGSYRKYYESEGKRISHIIDPTTGYSVDSDVISVTIYARDGITADGYDNAVLAMGLKKGMKFIEHHAELAAFFIYKDKSGNLQTAISSKFKKLLGDEYK